MNMINIADTNVVLPPSWAFGVLYGGYTNQQGTIQRVKEIMDHNYPIDAYWIDSWFWSFADKGIGPKGYLNFVGDTVSYPNRNAMWKFLHEHDIKGGFWIWNCILKTGNEKAFNEFKKRGFFSKIYLDKNSWHNGSMSTAMFQNGKKIKGTECGDIDFKNPKAVAFFKQKMKHFFDEGVDFLKLDRTSELSVCKAMFQMTQKLGKDTKGRGFILAHTGGQDNPEYKKYPARWTNDTRGDWNVETPTVKFNPWVPKVALKENIAMYTDPKDGSSEIPFLTNDMGGFDMGKVARTSEQLYIRWMEFSMFCPITEDFSQPENPTSNLAWKYSNRADSLFRIYSHLRMKLFPYIYSFAELTRIEGKNIIRKIPGHLYEYLFGNEILVAPVYQNGAMSRTVYLPEGNWINYWTGEKLKGNSEYTVSAPLEKMPLFVKQGAVIPMRNYASSIEKGNNDTLTLNIYPGSNGSFTLVEDDGTSNDYLKGGYASTLIQWDQTDTHQGSLTIHKINGNFVGISAQRNWKLVFHVDSRPEAIKLNGQKMSFEYSGSQKTATVTTGEKDLKQTLTCEILE
ncbi:MAG: glycoside hydrolase family 31 protein [Bacteroidales bacterium]|nr:glycoside hydrolase family 31 protein [Bacteroidales bacterium]